MDNVPNDGERSGLVVELRNRVLPLEAILNDQDVLLGLDAQVLEPGNDAESHAECARIRSKDK